MKAIQHKKEETFLKLNIDGQTVYSNKHYALYEEFVRVSPETHKATRGVVDGCWNMGFFACIPFEIYKSRLQILLQPPPMLVELKDTKFLYVHNYHTTYRILIDTDGWVVPVNAEYYELITSNGGAFNQDPHIRDMLYITQGKHQMGILTMPVGDVMNTECIQKAFKKYI